MREHPRRLLRGIGLPTRGLSSVRKCLELLELMAARHEPSGLSELGRTLGVPRGTMHQRLATLVDAGWVEQTADARYKLSQRLAVLGLAALEQMNLGAVVRKVMDELAAQTHERVDLAVLDSGAAVIVERVESSEALRAEYPLGTRLPLAHSAAGKVLVAFAPPAILDGLRRLGVDLPTAAEIEAIRLAGVALAVDEYLPGVAAASAPLVDASGHVLAALSLSAPSSRFDRTKAAAKVLDASKQVSPLLGGQLDMRRRK
jgi:IclR family transcriptional regulator, acetate operon repressor